MTSCCARGNVRVKGNARAHLHMQSARQIFSFSVSGMKVDSPGAGEEGNACEAGSTRVSPASGHAGAEA